ncbi:MAG: T9SS type A sorting domain-containing protein [Bacteroidota bacterium]
MRQLLLPMIWLLANSLAFAQFQNYYPHCEGNDHFVNGDFVWQATESGLVQYNLDGAVIATYDHSNSPIAPPFTSGKPSDVVVDAQNNVWVALGFDGVARLNPAGDWTVWPMDVPPFVNDDRINFTEIGISDNGVVCVSGFASNIYAFVNNSWRLELVVNGTREFETDWNGQVIAAAGSGVWRRDDNGNWTQIGNQLFNTNPIFDLTVDAEEQSIYFIDEGHNIGRILPNGPSTFFLTNGDKREGRAIIIDSQRRFWTGGFYRDFLSRYEGNNTWIDFDETNSSITGNIVNQLSFDQRDHLWVTQYPFGNDGLQRYDGNEWQAFYAGTPGSDEIEADNNDRLWLSRLNVLCRWNPANDQFDYYSLQNRTFPFNSLSIIAKGRGEEMWASTSLAGNNDPDRPNLARFDGSTWEAISSTSTNQGLPPGEITHLAGDQQGYVFLSVLGGNYDFGVSVYNTNNDTWDLIHSNSYLIQLPQNRIGDLKVNEQDQRLWVANFEGGLLRFDVNNRALEIFDANNVIGFPASIERLAPYQNQVWIISNEGLGLFERTTQQYQAFPSSPVGLLEGEIKDFQVDPQGRLWLTIQQDNSFFIQQFDGTNWTTFTANNSDFVIPANSNLGSVSDAWPIAFTNDDAWFGANIGLSRLPLNTMADCNLQASTNAPICLDNNTPNDPTDDRYQFELTVTGTNTSNTFNANLSNNLTTENLSASYGQVLNIDKAIAGGPLNISIQDQNDADCQASLTINPPATCSSGGDGIDLELSMEASNFTPNQWSTTSISVSITNTGTETATGISASFPLPNGAVFEGGNEFTASQGSFNPYGDRIWQVGSLGPGASAVLEVNLFVIQTDFVVYSQILTSDQTDSDSSPGNGTCCTANEDDEAQINIGQDIVDTTPPEVSIVYSGPDTIEVFPFSVDIFFSEPISGLPLNRITLINGTASDLTQISASHYRVMVSPNIEGAFSVIILADQVSDLAGNRNLASDPLILFYNIPGPDCLNINADFSRVFLGWNNFGALTIVNASFEGFGAVVGPAEGGFGMQQTIPVSPGEELQLTAQAGTLFNPSEAVMGIKFLDAAGADISQEQIPIGTPPYDFYELIATAPAEAQSAYAFIFKVGDVGIVNVDNLCLNRVTNISDEVDLNISLSASPINPNQYSVSEVRLLIQNEGLQDASGIRIHFPEPNGAVFSGGNEFTASQGSYQPYGNRIWEVGNLAAGASAEIVFNLFVLQGTPIDIYTEVIAQDQTDADSTPDNGNGSNAVEDDEASLTLNPSNNVNWAGINENLSGGYLNVYPNPVSSALNIRFGLPAAMQVEVSLVDVLGQLVLSKIWTLEKGEQHQLLNLADLSSGTYWLSIHRADYPPMIRRLVKH